MYDFLIYVLRAQPPHNGHLTIINEALRQSKKVILLLGSANCSRTIKNPFTFDERKDMVLSMFSPSEQQRLIVYSLDDSLYNDSKWISQVQNIVKEIIGMYPGNTHNVTLHGLNDIKIGLIGFSKDNTSYYLKLFPNFKSIDVKPFLYLNEVLNATDIRDVMFNTDSHDEFCEGWHMDKQLHPNVIDYLKNHRKQDFFKELQAEYDFIKQYKRSFKDEKYPRIHVTVDACVIQSGHILLVRRGARPGMNKIAMPGGFLPQDETLEESVINILRKKTGLKVPEPVLKGSIKKTMVFDNPDRSFRGRTLTHCFLIELSNDITLPKVKGADNSKSAWWSPLSDIENNANEFFEDHWHIIKKMI
jgi:bifunctional NMN adenylyltransferase/nudix hydrolase